MKNSLRPLLAALLSALPCSAAETFTLTPMPSNAQVMASGTTWTSPSTRVGLTSSAPYGCATVFVFALPKVAFGDVITSADFSFNLASVKGAGFAFNADLYSLGASSTDAVLTSDYFQGPFGTDANASPLQQAILTASPAMTAGRVHAGAAANAAIASELGLLSSQGVSAGSYYFLRLNPDFTAASSAVSGWNVSLQQDSAPNQPSLTISTAPAPQKGRVLIEYWAGVSGTALIQLTGNGNYPNRPTSREYATSMEIPSGLDQNSGTRLRGIFYPPTSGTYTFAVAGDDDASLRFGADGTPGSAVEIASVTGWTNPRQWDKYPSQQSAGITLQAGKPYYIEALHKQGTGGANLAVGCRPPGATAVTLVPIADVAPYDTGPSYAGGALSARLTRSHPRLMLSPAAIARLKIEVQAAGSTRASWWASVQSQATVLLSSPVLAPAANTSFINSARELQDRVYYLAMDYLLGTDATRRANCLAKIYDELQSAANWGGTNNNTAPGNWALHHVLDVPEIGHAYAIAYDWCHSGWTAAQRSFLASALSDRVLSFALTSYGPPAANHVDGNTNGVIVCNSGFALAAMAVLGEEPSTARAAATLDKALPMLAASSAMAAWGPDGAWVEAPVYWAFAMRYLSALLASLETSAGTCFSLDRAPGVSAAGSLPLYVSGPLKLSFNYSDEDGYDAAKIVLPAQMYLGVKYNQPVFSWFRRQFVSGHPLDLLWFDSRADGGGASPASLGLPTSTYFRNTGIITLRSAWADTNALFAGLKAGYNPRALPYGTVHQQLEIGSFVFDALGVRWALDFGRDNYTAPYWNPWPSNTTPNRWQYYRCRPEGNNTLVVNPGSDGGQSLDGVAPVIDFRSTAIPNLQQAVIDMTDAYARDTQGNPTAVTGAVRGMRFTQATNVARMVAQLQDDVSTNSASPVALNWFMHTKASISLSGGTALLSSGDKRLLLTIRSPAGATFSSMPAQPLPTSSNYSGFPNSALPGPEIQTVGVSKLRIQWNAPAGAQSTRILVDMCPYVNGQTVPLAPTTPVFQ